MFRELISQLKPLMDNPDQESVRILILHRMHDGRVAVIMQYILHQKAQASPFQVPSLPLVEYISTSDDGEEKG